MPIGINVEHLLSHIRTQNGPAKSLIKCLQLIARPLLMNTKPPTSSWGHVVLRIMELERIKPIIYHKYILLLDPGSLGEIRLTHGPSEGTHKWV